MNPADSHDGIRIPTKAILSGNTEQDCIYSGRNCQAISDFKKDFNKETEWRAEVNHRPKTDHQEFPLKQPSTTSDEERSTNNIRQTERRDSSVSSVSLRSEGSIQMPPNLREESASGTISRSQTERRESSFSYISLRSDGSIQMPPNLGEGHVPETTRKGKEKIRRWDRLSPRPKPNSQRQQSSQRLTVPSSVSEQIADTIEDSPNVQKGVAHCHISLHTDRRGSSTSTCSSVQSDVSRDQPHIKYGAVCFITRHKTDHQESASSHIPFQSDWAVELPPNISHEGLSTINIRQTERRDSSVSSVSLRSEGSIQMPPNLREESASGTIRCGRDRLQALGCASVTSDSSLDNIVHFGQVDAHTHQRCVRDRPHSPGCASVASDSSLDNIVHFGQADAHTYCRCVRDRPQALDCASVTSDSSLDNIVHFGQADAHVQGCVRDRPQAPGCASVTSDSSLDNIVHFGQADAHTHQRVQVEEFPNKRERLAPYDNRRSMYRPHSPSPSHTSTDSDSFPERLSSSDQAAAPLHCSIRQTESRNSSFSSESLRSEHSIQIPPNPNKESASASTSTSLPSQHNPEKFEDIKRAIEGHKASLRKRFEIVPKESTKLNCDVPFHAIYTELYLMAGVCQQINVEHEVQQIEMMCRGQTVLPNEAIKCSDIFKFLQREQISTRTVMTKGIAGIGKTMFVQKFILDWAEGQANQDLDLVFVLPFRELNMMVSKQNSLHSLLVELFEDLKILEDLKVYKECKLLFILDGLDESKLHLDFQGKKVCDTNKAVSVSELVTNLIRGDLLPTSLIWVTSRPAAASQIPAQYIDQVTELRGFSDAQKEEFIRRKVGNQTVASNIISHVRATRSLLIMCYIPVFCSLITTMFQQTLDKKPKKNIPTNMTEVFTEFITTLVNTQQQLQEAKGEVICKLAKLAFCQLQKQQFTFYEDDLRECGIKTSNAPVFSGLCIEILKEESLNCGQRTYSFLHLTIQEFLAALYVIHSFLTKNTEALESFQVSMTDKTTDLYDLLKDAVDKSLQDEYGHLDLFLRFLLGLSLQPNQKFFQILLKSKQSIDIKKKISERTDQISKKQTRTKIIAYIKDLRKENLSPERCINLFHCLLEMRDFTMQEEVKDFLRSERCPRFLSPAHCSALAYIHLMSEKALEELDLRQYNTTDEGCIRLLPAIRWCRKARLDCCKLAPRAYQTVALGLQSLGSPLIELDLSYNCLKDSGLDQLAKGLRSPHCKLKTLSLVGCHLTESSCSTMASVLQLDQSSLSELDLSDNDLRDLGVENLASGLQSLTCKVQILRLSVCGVSTKACTALAAALSLNPSHLKELDLSYNYPKCTGVEQLSAKQQDPDCALETLNVKHAGGYRLLSAPQKYFYKLHLDPMTAHRNLTLSERNRQVTRGPARPSIGEPEPPQRFDFWPQVLCREPLTGRCYWEVEWTGTAAIGLAYRGIISKKGRGDDGLLGNYPKSLALYCDEKSYSVHHNKKKIEIDFPPYECRRVGVFLDWPNGSVSFYRISSEKMLLLRTLYTNFNQPLYAGFTIHSSDTVISLCNIQTS